MASRSKSEDGVFVVIRVVVVVGGVLIPIVVFPEPVVGEGMDGVVVAPPPVEVVVIPLVGEVREEKIT